MLLLLLLLLEPLRRVLTTGRLLLELLELLELLLLLELLASAGPSSG